MRDRLRWRLRALLLGARMKPVRGAAEDDGDGDGDDGGDAGDAGSGDPGDAAARGDAGATGDAGSDDGDGDKPDPPATRTAEEIRKQLRETERRSRRESARKDKELAELRQRLKEREDADKSEQEKAVEAARTEGRREVEEKVAAERRRDRLEVAATRLATKGIQVGEGDERRRVRFADPEDALVHLERAVRNDAIDDPFDENGNVRVGALETALAELLEQKPHLREAERRAAPPAGDAGRGSDDAQKTLEEMSPDDHLRMIQEERRGGGLGVPTSK